MTHFGARSTIDEFKYTVITQLFDQADIDKFRDWVYKGHCDTIKKNFTSKDNSQWITRNYLSAKMILSATVMVTSLEYAIKHNLKMSIPYLSYYATITCCRAFLYTIPENTWNYSKNGNKKFLEMSHSTIINCTGSYLNRLDTVFAENTKKTIKDLKEWRELFSYKFPSSGLSVIRNYDVNEIIEICSIMCELAQLSSEQIQKYVSKKCMYNYEEWAEPEVDLMEAGFMYNDIIDPEDAFRVRYLSRKQPFPVSIYYTMTEGMVEDYFGAWQEEGEDNYDPDKDWQIIFPVP